MKRSFSSRDDRLHACAPERTKRLGLTGARLAVGLGLSSRARLLRGIPPEHVETGE